MGLIANGFRDSGGLYLTSGATASNNAYPSAVHANRALAGSLRNLTFGEGITSELVGVPSGYRHPAAWMMPQKPGLLAARNTAIGSGGVSSATMQSGYNIDATITGSGGVDSTSTFLGLIVSLAATLTASGGISSASANALATMVAELTGSGDVSATAAGLAELGATLTGSGGAVGNNTALMDITATIRGYGDLTPEGIRDTVWNAILANYPEAGTAGSTLASAGAAGDPLLGVVEGTLTLRDVQRIVLAVLAGQVTGAGSGTETFKGQAGENRVASTVDNDGNRSSVTLDAT